MEARLKAKELVDFYYYLLPFLNTYYEAIETSKRCAVIAVNELIKETGSKYWYDVKKEIEKM